jgi:hypothetical protein
LTFFIFFFFHFFKSLLKIKKNEIS